MICEHCRVTGAHEAALDLADFFSVSSHANDIRAFDTRWDHAAPTEHALEGL